MTRLSKPAPLYHFTCSDHGYPGIMGDTIRPTLHPLMPHLGPLLWLTDLANPPTADSIGFGSGLLDCDRLAHRFLVSLRPGVAKAWTTLRSRVDDDVVKILDSYGQPEHWFVVRRPLLVSEWTYDTDYSSKESASAGVRNSLPSAL